MNIIGIFAGSMVCLHGKSDASCCGKLNGVIKDSKEIKAKKQNWGIKLSCTKLKGMKSLPTSISSERKYSRADRWFIINVAYSYSVITVATHSNDGYEGLQ